MLLFFVVIMGRTYASTPEVNRCYEQKDKDCLESIFKDIVSNPSQEKHDAMYYLGEIYLEENNYEAAKKQFTIAAMFGDGQRSKDKLIEIIKSGNVQLEPLDCFRIATEECFHNVAKTKPDKADVAYYFLGQFLEGSDPKRAIDFTIKAAELGHKTSACLVASAYGKEKFRLYEASDSIKAALPKDYAKARAWGEKCGAGAFGGYSKKHFKKYADAKDHKAYAKSGSKHLTYSQGAATPEIAIYLAGALCQSRAKRKKSKEPCLVVNVDNRWIDYRPAPSRPDRTGSVEDLYYNKARIYFENKYKNAKGVKVFVQGPLGNWSAKIRPSGHPIEELSKAAIDTCQNGWSYKEYGSACKVINVNGEWVN